MTTHTDLTLYDYWRSSACYRVRIALNLKRLAYTTKPVHLLNDGGEQHAPAYRELNPQESVPVLVDGQRVIRQSMAIIEYLDDVNQEYPLLPALPRDRAHVRGLAQLIACDVHPLNNLRVMQYLERDLGVDAAARERWTKHWIELGFRAFEAILVCDVATGEFCHGDTPGLADACLVPQVYNAKRFGVDLSPYPTLAAINDRCLAMPEFEAAKPENQPGAA
ncbi:maleylacetoacetate isomerase [Dokdonella sp.]|uniref:maleylacetoacetate isomerase n=1 Tax=Dokdonella sp. TaxID=2291710 RepID=UPI002F42F5F4